MFFINKQIIEVFILTALVFALSSFKSTAQSDSFSRQDFNELDKLLGIWKTEKKNGTLYDNTR